MGMDIVTAISCGSRHTALLTASGRVIIMGQIGYVYVCFYMHWYIAIYVCICMYMYVCMYVCVCICMYIYASMYMYVLYMYCIRV